MRPADDIRLDGSKVGNLAILYGDKAGAFRTGLADMAALQVAAEDNVRVAVKHVTLMHMRERPIIVPLVDEIIEAARRVIGMTAYAPQVRYEGRRY